MRCRLDDDSFDLALTVAAMHHIAAPDAVHRTLAEMVRVTRPGGRVLIWDHNPRNPYWSNLMSRVPQDTGEERLIASRRGDGWPDRGRRPGAVKPAAGAGAGFHATPPRCAPPRSPSGFSSATPYLKRYGAHNVIVARKRG